MKNGDTIPIVYSTTATTASPVVSGGYPITASTADANYAATIVNGTLTVTPKPLTIAVNSFSKVYGTANPPLTGVITGVLPGDNVVGHYPTTAAQYSYVGTYPLTATISGSSVGNYNIGSITPGVLTVTQALLTIVVKNGTKVYGMANPALATIFVGLVNGDKLASAYATAATASSPVGGYPVTLTLSGALLPNYKPTIVNGTLTVTKAPLRVTGFVNGDKSTVVAGAAAETTTAVKGSPVGAYPITVAQGTLAATNYSFAFVNGILTVTEASVTAAAARASRMYRAANPAFTTTIKRLRNGNEIASRDPATD